MILTNEEILKECNTEFHDDVFYVDVDDKKWQFYWDGNIFYFFEDGEITISNFKEINEQIKGEIIENMKPRAAPGGDPTICLRAQLAQIDEEIKDFKAYTKHRFGWRRGENILDFMNGKLGFEYGKLIERRDQLRKKLNPKV